MRGSILLGILSFGFVLLALVINIRLKIVKVPFISLGAFLFGDLGHADGLKLLLWIIIDLALYTIVVYTLVLIALRLYERVTSEDRCVRMKIAILGF